MKFLNILVIERKIGRQHSVDDSDHFLDIWFIDTDFVLDYKLHISFFLLSDITIDDGDFVHHKNFHECRGSSFGDDDIRDVYQVIHEVDKSEYFDGRGWIGVCDVVGVMVEVFVSSTNKHNLCIYLGIDKFL